jgi:hypothetical protein
MRWDAKKPRQAAFSDWHVTVVLQPEQRRSSRQNCQAVTLRSLIAHAQGIAFDQEASASTED